jgi:hypothetical protein
LEIKPLAQGFHFPLASGKMENPHLGLAFHNRGFVGPSFCFLCHQNEEMVEHFLNSCSFSSELWDQGASLFQQSNRHRDNIHDTLASWHNNIYENLMLNRIWQLFLGFVMWETWKERNQCILKDTEKNKLMVWECIKQNIQETIRLTH